MRQGFGRQQSDDVMLVGSIPHTSIPQAMEIFGGPLGRHLCALPDGEVGWRRFWITRVHFQVLAIHPDLEIIQRPRRDDGIERINPHDASDNWNFKVKHGVDKVVFGHAGWRLGFYQDAAAFIARQQAIWRALAKDLDIQPQ